LYGWPQRSTEQASLCMGRRHPGKRCGSGCAIAVKDK